MTRMTIALSAFCLVALPAAAQDTTLPTETDDAATPEIALPDDTGTGGLPEIGPGEQMIDIDPSRGGGSLTLDGPGADGTPSETEPLLPDDPTRSEMGADRSITDDPFADDGPM